MKRAVRLDVRLPDRHPAFCAEFPQFRKHEGAFPAVAAKDVLAAPQDAHQGRTRDPAYIGGTTFGARGHGEVPVDVEVWSTTYQSLPSYTVR